MGCFSKYSSLIASGSSFFFQWHVWLCDRERSICLKQDNVNLGNTMDELEAMIQEEAILSPPSSHVEFTFDTPANMRNFNCDCEQYNRMRY
ncbi:hypothetical protein TSUD_277860 [Trifolium subterraneum]|uniref:Uncharacterized protein n=1 Tax=Trifolium subterraneum TaxID=3900 RepID=A0A2Z6MHS9_TRISU|nr:hypothetical protein TSUD_277860 [Trifolium subterraneum]